MRKKLARFFERVVDRFHSRPNTPRGIPVGLNSVTGKLIYANELDKDLGEATVVLDADPSTTEQFTISEDIEITAREVVDRIMGRETKWVNWQKMNEAERMEWSNQAKSLLANPVFQSICGRKEDGKIINGSLAKDLMENSFRSAGDYQMLKDARMILCGVERVRELAEEMVYTKQEPTKNNLNAAI